MSRPCSRKYTKKQVSQALEKHPTREATANSLGCSPSGVTRLIDKVFPDLKHLAK